ncbi:MAG: hypothetical protein ABSD88_10890 [Candidatus Korobacteraceae bacterium]|jgi:hypothetical protein
MTTMKLRALLILAVVTASVAWQGAEAKKKKTDAERLAEAN